MDSAARTFIFHWLDGKVETSKGANPADAFMHLGYGNGAISALDYYEEQEDDNGPA